MASCLLFGGLLVAQADSVRAGERWSLADGRTTLTFNAPTMERYGLRVMLPESIQVQRDAGLSQVTFTFDSNSQVNALFADGLLEQIDGAIPHEGNMALVGPGGTRIVRTFALRLDQAMGLLVALDNQDASSVAFTLRNTSMAVDPVSGALFFASDRLFLSPEWATALGVEGLAEEPIGSVVLEARMNRLDEGMIAEDGSAQLACPGAADPPLIGPDVIIGSLSSVYNYGTMDGISAFAVGTNSCNIGDECLSWVASTNKHPVIDQGMFRLKNGRFEQIGMGWLKHGFTALTGNLCGLGCTPPGTGALLGVGCSDPYSASLNGTQSILGPRSQVNAHTGYFPYPIDMPNRPCSGCSRLDRRIQVHNEDLANPGAQYFIEGHYIASDEAEAGNGNNSASYRPIYFGARKCRMDEDPYSFTEILCTTDVDCPDAHTCTWWPTSCLSSLGTDGFCAIATGSTQREQAAIRAWRDHDAGVVETDVQIPDEGLVILAAKAVEIGGGAWRYEYAIENLNSDRSIQSFSIPLPPGVVVQGEGFHDVDYHSGDPFETAPCMRCENDPGIVCVGDSDCAGVGGRCVADDAACSPGTCGGECIGGTNAGDACFSGDDCRACTGGSNFGQPCVNSLDCPGASCIGSCAAFCLKTPCTDDSDCFGAQCDVGTGECENDWPASVNAESISWSTTGHEADRFANALRWGTLYNFWFEASVGPDTATATLGLFKPGFPAEVTASTIGPALGLVDCNNNKEPDACDIDCGALGCEPPCGGSIDCDDNGIPDECDPDCNGNERADRCDIDVSDGGLCTGPDCSSDCQPNTVPDECEPDCDGDGLPDSCEGFDDCDGDGIEDCDDECPCTTPVGSCVCPDDGCCTFDDPKNCLTLFDQDTCEGLGGTWVCNHAPCLAGCLMGDWDRDGDLDLEDGSAFQLCFSGPIEDPSFESPSQPCLDTFDFDFDGDIDHDDLKAFEGLFTGPSAIFNVCPGLCAGCDTEQDCDDQDACTEDTCKGEVCIHLPLSDCVSCEPVYTCDPIDVVFVMDTSGSMGDEAAALCDKIADIIADVEALGVTINPVLLGITEIPNGFSCLTDTVIASFCELVSCPVGVCDFPNGTSPAESWGPATTIVAERFPWTEGAFRMIIPLGDEGPCNGSLPDGCNEAGDDGASITEAIAVAVARGVAVSPITGTGSDVCVRNLAEALAAGTGGTAFHTQDAGADLAGAIVGLLLRSCSADDGCDDQDECTGEDTCVDGICVGTPIPECQSCEDLGTCTDGNACTDDVCEALECISTPNFNEVVECCDPVSGIVTPLDDGDGCTQDTCDPATGEVTHTPADDGTACDDGVFCNGADTCSTGTCSGHAGDPCTTGTECANACSEEGQTCDVPAGTPCTEDGNVCTDDVCDGAGQCTIVENSAPCDDGVFCNGDDSCSGGTCSIHTGDACAGGPECADACNEIDDTCNLSQGTPCTDDSNVCTDNQCDGAGSCVAVDNTALCDDGLYCNGDDTCSDGACSAHNGDPCADGPECSNSCNETTNACLAPEGTPCTDDGNVCTDNQCDDAGFCVAVNNTGTCNDGDECTTDDACDGAGTCVGTPLTTTECTGLAEICLEANSGTMPYEGCYRDDEFVIVNIVLKASPVLITGGQFAIRYDPTVLRVVSIDPGSTVDPGSPFSVEILEVVDEVGGEIFYVVGIVPGGTGTKGPAVMGTIRFESLVTCANIGPMCFRDEFLPKTALTDDTGQNVPFKTCCTKEIVIPDPTVPPTIKCPPDVIRNSDPGTIKSIVEWEPVEVNGGCAGLLSVTCTATHDGGANIDHLIERGGLFPAGLSMFECMVTDGCDGTETCRWTVQINATNTFKTKVQFSPTMVPGPLNRCILFEFYSSCVEPPTVVEQVLEFGLPYSLPGQAANVMLKIPAGKYACVTARDPLHSLRGVSDIVILDGMYVANFVGDPFFDGNWLTGGNLNGDGVIDILDFGIYLAEELSTILANTTCETPTPHADINGDGMVDAFDLAFISGSFGVFDKDSCCPSGSTSGITSVMEISVRELDQAGLHRLRVADLNRDGLLNYQDVIAALRGERPTPKPRANRESNLRR